MDLELLKNIIAIAAGVISLLALGVLNTLKQTISAQKEYIVALEQKIDGLKSDTAEQNERYHQLELQLRNVEGRLDTIRDIPLKAIADSLKVLLDNQQAYFQENPLKRSTT